MQRAPCSQSAISTSLGLPQGNAGRLPGLDVPGAPQPPHGKRSSGQPYTSVASGCDGPKICPDPMCLLVPLPSCPLFVVHNISPLWILHLIMLSSR